MLISSMYKSTSSWVSSWSPVLSSSEDSSILSADPLLLLSSGSLGSWFCFQVARTARCNSAHRWAHFPLMQLFPHFTKQKGPVSIDILKYTKPQYRTIQYLAKWINQKGQAMLRTGVRRYKTHWTIICSSAVLCLLKIRSGSICNLSLRICFWPHSVT